MKWRNLLGKGCILLIAIILLQNCNSNQKVNLSEQQLALEWAKLTLHITQFTPANSPTFASRGFGYIGLTMYESIVHGYDSHRSVSDQLNGLGQLPVPDSSLTYNWPLSLNAAQAFILKNIYQQTSDENKLKIDSLETAIKDQFSRDLDSGEINRSIAFGRAVASHIYEWSKTDGGHRGYLKNFDKEMVHPERPGSWKPPLFAQSFSHLPLHPHWGGNRTFVKQNTEIPIPYMIPYDTVPDSPYYKEFMSVYEKDLELTQKEKEAAIWWGDDPDVT
ncbi:MAG: phosphoesterase, partial [Eudoraea sp.]|nr:phosphoesterase [Eudoraea sp.]